MFGRMVDSRDLKFTILGRIFGNFASAFLEPQFSSLACNPENPMAAPRKTSIYVRRLCPISRRSAAFRIYFGLPCSKFAWGRTSLLQVCAVQLPLLEA